MGWLDSSAAKARDKQKASILAEARAAGLRVVAQEDYDAGCAGRATLGTALRGALGGSHELAPDGLQIFLLEPRQKAGPQLAVVQPYTGGFFLPGEIHARLDGCLPGPLALAPPGGLLGMGAGQWKGSGSARKLAPRLDRNPCLARAVKPLKFHAQVGELSCDLEWALQLVPTGDGRSLLVFSYAQYGTKIGLNPTYTIGIKHFMTVAGVLGKLLEDADHPASRPLFPFLHEAEAESVLDPGAAPPAEPEAAPPSVSSAAAPTSSPAKAPPARPKPVAPRKRSRRAGAPRTAPPGRSKPFVPSPTKRKKARQKDEAEPTQDSKPSAPKAPKAPKRRRSVRDRFR